MSSWKKGIVYKEVGDLDITLDCYVPDDAEGVPVLLWFHGVGGLLQGRRDEVAPHMIESVNKYKHALVTADYRLAPQVNLPAILEDVKACIDFIRNPKGLVTHLRKTSVIDKTRLAVSGSSAGGYLALLAGLYVEPKPQVILALYPITDPLGLWFINDQVGTTYEGEEFGQERRVVFATVDPFMSHDDPAVANNAPNSDRNKMYTMAINRGDLGEHLGMYIGPNAYKDAGNDSVRIAKQIVDCGLPPVYIAHGTEDKEVDIEQSDQIAGILYGEQMEVKYERLRGWGHSFDAKKDANHMVSMYEFMHKHV